ncbi:hypothetical protein PMAYCL1PPCAC_09995, partial [Pristionchus mayeri]
EQMDDHCIRCFKYTAESSRYQAFFIVLLTISTGASAVFINGRDVKDSIQTQIYAVSLLLLCLTIYVTGTVAMGKSVETWLCIFTTALFASAVLMASTIAIIAKIVATLYKPYPFPFLFAPSIAISVALMPPAATMWWKNMTTKGQVDGSSAEVITRPLEEARNALHEVHREAKPRKTSRKTVLNTEEKLRRMKTLAEELKSEFSSASNSARGSDVKIYENFNELMANAQASPHTATHASAKTPIASFAIGECKICMERPINALLVHCGHPICVECGDKVKESGQGCPQCRQPIEKVQRMFL